MPELLTSAAKVVHTVNTTNGFTEPDRCYLCCYIRLNRDLVALVDPDDWVRLHKYHWYARKTKNGFYAVRKVRIGQKRQLIYMHREIAGTPAGMETHHKNTFKLDNRKENLDIVTPNDHRFISKGRRRKWHWSNVAEGLPI